MANHLKMAVIQAILTLYARGWSRRRIARELDVDRETVARHLARAVSKPATLEANPPPGCEAGFTGVCELREDAWWHSKPATPADNPPHGAEGGMTGVCVEREDAWWDSKPATPPRNPPHGSEGGERWSDVTAAVPMPVAATGTGPVSTCEPFRAIIEQKVKEGLSGRRIYQDLASDANGLPSPSYDAIKRFLRHMYKGRELPFRRMEVPAGDECQVDFGTGAFVVGPDGKRKKTHVLRIVLSCSRKAYSEAVYRQTTEDFLACLENAFHAFGGVTRTVAGIRRRAGDVCVHRIASDHP